jgi:hypothetical protein
MTFNVDIINPTTGQVVGQAQAALWTDPVSGTTYTVPVGFDPQAIMNQFALSEFSSNNLYNLNYGGDPDAMAIGSFFADTNALYDGYQAGGAYDLQRTTPDGTSYDGYVPAFTPIASFSWGLGSAAYGLPTSGSICAAGIYNKFWGGKDTSGACWNNPNGQPPKLGPCGMGVMMG